VTTYAGPPLRGGAVNLAAPSVVTERLIVAADADLEDDQQGWLGRAGTDAAILYFAVEHEGCVVGQIFLHDADWRSGGSMVGYHLFRASDRGRGYGGEALRLLVEHCRSTLRLRTLVSITSVENIASRRIAEKAGFVEAGAAREGAHLIVYKLTLS
jgi:RimJ/RimL family protein N-acetyltransferase